MQSRLARDPAHAAFAIERSKGVAIDIPHMSRFAIRDMGTTVAAGLCLDIEER